MANPSKPSLLTWRSVKAGLTRILGKSERERKWLDALEGTTPGKQLAVNLYIDLLKERVSVFYVRRILERVDHTAPDPSAEFGRAVTAIEKEDDRSEFRNRLGKGTADSGRAYARITELSSFIMYYVTPNTYHTSDSVDSRQVLRNYFGTHRGIPLGKVKSVWMGGRERAWVMPGTDADDIVSKPARDARALMIRLGLKYEDNSGTLGTGMPHLVCVRYPDGVSLSTAVPTTLDAEWTRGTTYFLSSGAANGWGRTHPLTGEGDGFDELIHGPIHGLDDNYKGHDIGDTGPVEDKPESILPQAYLRLRAILDEGGRVPNRRPVQRQLRERKTSAAADQPAAKMGKVS